MFARYEAFSLQETLPAFKSVWVLGVFWLCFLLLFILGFLTAKQESAGAWTGTCLFLFYLTCPCQGLGFLSCGDERKMSLMSCAAELSARSCCMGVLSSASLPCAVMVLQWIFSSWKGFSRGAERAGQPLKAWRALHRGLHPLTQHIF